MKLLHYIPLILFLLFAGWFFFVRNDKDISEEKRYFDNVYHVLQRAHALDSIKSIQDKRYMDSINTRLNQIELGIRKTGIELKRLRTRNEDALHKLDSLMPSVRPNF